MKKYWKIILPVALIVIGVVAWYGISEYNKGPKDIKGKKADVTIQAAELTKAYADDEAKANGLYNDKAVSVSGVVKTVEKDDKGIYTVTLAGDGDMSNVICSIDERYNDDAKNVKEGSTVTINGFCNGAQTMLGTDVMMNRCVVAK